MAGDVVGYTRLMAEHEAVAHGEVRAAFSEVVAPAVESHGGRIFKTTGDGFLAAFASVNGALDAGLSIQAGLCERTLVMRIGINLGDVIEENGDMFGDGVNIASRLEAMAEPGSIFVSESVVRSADRGHDDLFYRVGRRRAKNLPDSMEVYAVRLDNRGPRAAQMLLRILRRTTPAIHYTVGVCVLALLIAATQISSLSVVGSDVTGSITSLMDHRAAEARPSVAVLPFDNMSGDTGQTYFSDGLTEDVIANLSRNPDLLVIARNSTFALRGQVEDVRAIGNRLGAVYVVEGSVRRAGDQLRIVAQLVETSTGSHLWSRTYDRRIDDLFAIQNDLTSEIVSHIVSYVRASEADDAAARPPESLRAYDLLLRSRDRYKEDARDLDALMASRAFLQRALELDPAYAAAHAGLAMTYVLDFAHSVSGEATRADLDTGLSEARHAVRLDPNLAAGYRALSFGLVAAGEFAPAIQAAERAVELNPNDPDSLMTLAKAQVRFGGYDEAVSNAERARRLHPLAPEYYVYIHGQALYAAGRFEEADHVIQECLLRAPRESDCLLIRAAAQSARGDTESARMTMAQLTQADPEFSLSGERGYRRFGESLLMDRFLSQLSVAGAPEVSTSTAVDVSHGPT